MSDASLSPGTGTGAPGFFAGDGGAGGSGAVANKILRTNSPNTSRRTSLRAPSDGIDAGVILAGCSLAAYFSGCMTCSVDSGGERNTSSTLGHGCERRIDSTNKRPVRYGNISVSLTNAGALSN